MMSSVRSLVLAVLAGLLVAGSAGALTPPERKCQEAIAAGGRRAIDRAAKALSACAARVARGGQVSGGSCVAATSTVRAKVVDAAFRPLRRHCSDAAVAVLAPAGDCRDATSLATLTACLRATHDAGAVDLSAVVDATAGKLSAAARKCRKQAAKQARRFAGARQRLLQLCKHEPEKYELAVGRTCADSPRVAPRVAAFASRGAQRIARACPAAVIAEAPFGTPCAVAPDVPLCLLAEAEVVVDRAIEAEYADTAFCGDTGAAVEARIDTLLSQMSLADKLAQMHGVGAGSNAWRTPGVAALGIPGFGMVDGPRGVGRIAGNATAFPVAMARGATWDPALEERVGEAIGTETRAKTASVILAPTINVLRHPRWGRAQETYGEDTTHLGAMGAFFVRGAQRRVIANPKHFAVNSIEDTRFNVDVAVDERTLREIYLRHFEETVQRGRAASMMTAYNLVNGAYCAENDHLVGDILKGDWRFQGFVESDWLLGTRSTVPSITAGLDIEMPLPAFYGDPLADAVADGSVPVERIDAAVRRILRTQLCFRLDTDPPVADATQVESAAHVALAREVAQKSLVLLRNADGALPLDRGGLQSIAVVGALAATPNIGDTGSSSVSPTTIVTPLAGIQAAAGTVAVTHVSGPALSPADEAAIGAADAALVFVGLTAADEGESLVGAGDRESLDLPAGQDALVAAVAALNPRTIVVLEGSGAVLMPWIGDVQAVLMAWYPGQQGGNALADVLFGDVNPSGKLPVTFPVQSADLPPFDNVDLDVTYGYFHGYRWLDHEGTAPLFPFGHGLSYTSFRTERLTVEPATISPWGRARVTVDVTNTGTVAGDEVVQLYVGYPGSAVERAVRDLKDFARVSLAPGETRTVVLEVDARDLAYWDVAIGGWVVEPLQYALQAGTSVADLPLSASLSIAP